MNTMALARSSLDSQLSWRSNSPEVVISTEVSLRLEALRDTYKNNVTMQRAMTDEAVRFEDFAKVRKFSQGESIDDRLQALGEIIQSSLDFSKKFTERYFIPNSSVRVAGSVDDLMNIGFLRSQVYGEKGYDGAFENLFFGVDLDESDSNSLIVLYQDKTGAVVGSIRAIIEDLDKGVHIMSESDHDPNDLKALRELTGSPIVEGSRTVIRKDFRAYNNSEVWRSMGAAYRLILKEEGFPLCVTSTVYNAADKFGKMGAAARLRIRENGYKEGEIDTRCVNTAYLCAPDNVNFRKNMVPALHLPKGISPDLTPEPEVRRILEGIRDRIQREDVKIYA